MLSVKATTSSLNNPLFFGGMRDETAMPKSRMEGNSNSAEATVSISQLLPPLQPNSRRIYLIRHGETEWNVQGRIQGGGSKGDIPLNDRGKMQARAVAATLHDVPFSVVCSSTLSRASETADILWHDHPTTCTHRELAPGLVGMGFGEFEGLAHRNPDADVEVVARFKEFDRKVNEDPDFAFPGGGESTRMVEERVCRTFFALLDKYPEDKHIAVVSHRLPIKFLIHAIAPKDEEFRAKFQAQLTPKQEKKEKTAINNTAINVLDVDSEGKWKIRILDYIEHVKNNRSHLDEPRHNLSA